MQQKKSQVNEAQIQRGIDLGIHNHKMLFSRCNLSVGPLFQCYPSQRAQLTFLCISPLPASTRPSPAWCAAGSRSEVAVFCPSMHTTQGFQAVLIIRLQKEDQYVEIHKYVYNQH